MRKYGANIFVAILIACVIFLAWIMTTNNQPSQAGGQLSSVEQIKQNVGNLIAQNPTVIKQQQRIETAVETITDQVQNLVPPVLQDQGYDPVVLYVIQQTEADFFASRTYWHDQDVVKCSGQNHNGPDYYIKSGNGIHLSTIVGLNTETGMLTLQVGNDTCDIGENFFDITPDTFHYLYKKYPHQATFWVREYGNHYFALESDQYCQEVAGRGVMECHVRYEDDASFYWVDLPEARFNNFLTPRDGAEQLGNATPGSQRTGFLTADQIEFSHPLSGWKGPIPDSFSNLYVGSVIPDDYAGKFVELRVGDTYDFPYYGCHDDTVMRVKVEEITPLGARFTGLGHEDGWVDKGSGFSFEKWDCDVLIFQQLGSVEGVLKLSGQPAVVKIYMYEPLQFLDNYWIYPMLKQDLLR